MKGRDLGRELRTERDDPAAVRRERDPLDAKLLGEWADARGEKAEDVLSRLEALASDQPEQSYVSLPGDWGRVLFIIKERDRFVGYEYGGGQVWTRTGGDLDYFLAAPLGVQRLSRDEAAALLEGGA